LAAAAGTAGAVGIKQLYQTEVESWRELQSRNIEFTMKRLPEHDRALAYLCRINLCSARSEVNRRAHRQM
jgi:hypothetical protein